MIVGGPCACCGATQASIWYGKKDEMKYCKKAACMRAGGYLAAQERKKEKEKKVKRARGGGLGLQLASKHLALLIPGSEFFGE